MGSNSSIVISFAIAILLLLILMLLLSYNSKCKADKVERFIPTFNNSNNTVEPLLNYQERFENEVKQSFKKPTEDKFTIPDPYKPGGSMAIVDNFSNNSVALNDPTATIYPYNEIVNNDEDNFTNPTAEMQDPTTCFKRDRLTKDDLLPKDANLKWAQVNPSSAGDITDKNFLTAGYHIGINTVGQSLRNANLQLRSEIPNPQVAVSPWMISTIEPDIRPVSFEIGSAPSY
jgi:hypothetical protein